MTQAYSEPEPCQICMELFVKITNSFKPLIIFAKRSILDVWLGFEYKSGVSASKHLFKAETVGKKYIAINWNSSLCRMVLESI